MSLTVMDHPFLRGFTPHQRQMLDEISTPVEFLADEFLVRQGKIDERFFLVHSGLVAIQTYSVARGSLTLDSVGDGECVGWSWVIPPYRTHFDAVAYEPVSATAIDAVALRQLCNQECKFGFMVLQKMVQIMEQRLQAARLMLVDFYGTHP